MRVTRFTALASMMLLASCGDHAGVIPPSSPYFRLRGVPVFAPYAARIATGADHSCYLDTGGKAFCFGNNNWGQLGDGTRTQRELPVRVAGGLTFREIAAGDQFTCALTTVGRAVCWGRNEEVQLGNSSRSSRNVPTEVTFPTQPANGYLWTTITVGRQHACVMSQDGRVYCWGNNASGQLGIGTRDEQASPRFIFAPTTGGRWFAISAGYSHTCGIVFEASGAFSAWCWGSNEWGELGIGNQASPRLAPAQVVGGGAFISITANVAHTCAIASTQDAYCWGRNIYGQVGNRATDSAFATPQRVSPTSTLFALSKGGSSSSYTCAVTTAWAGYCWGNNLFGNIGDGTRVNNRSSPTAISGGLRLVEISIGSAHACGRSFDGLYCWGNDSYGQLGTGPDRTNSPTPVRVRLR